MCDRRAATLSGMTSRPETRRETEIVDVMRVPLDGDPLVAVVPVPPADERAGVETVECDVLVVGGGTGGVAAALAAARRGRRVELLEETDWLGGQFTAQGVSALDEHEHIERFGGTASYYALRDAIRAHYRALALGPVRHAQAFNPGNCWVSRVAFEAPVAEAIATGFLQPHVEAGRLRVHRRTRAIAATVADDRIVDVAALDLERGDLTRFRPAIVVDATELGEFLPLAGAEHVVGAETIEQTGEPHAQPLEPKPDCVQSFTYTFALERGQRGEDHTIRRPARYEHFRAAQPYSLRIEVHGGEIYGEESGWLDYRIFERMPGTKGGLWTYRRLVDAAQFVGRYAADRALINWPGNDYRDARITEGSAADQARALQDAKRASLGFLYWLQTEAPADGDRRGAPELQLMPELMGTVDGLSKYPYVREARRIRALRTVVEQDVSVEHQPGARAAFFPDSVGVGWYPIDIHRSGPEDVGISTRTRPFQIPLGALVPVRLTNLLAGAKNIGTTHITNGCYRLHPVEWNIGEAAGALAAFSLGEGRGPRAVARDAGLLARFQDTLLDDGVPLTWEIDVGVGDPRFVEVQRELMRKSEARDPTSLEFSRG
jgi:hypothetical protein